MKPNRRRRQQSRGGGSGVGIMVVMLIVVGLAVYFGAAGVVGNWLAEKVVSPVLSRLGLWESSALPSASQPADGGADPASSGSEGSSDSNSDPANSGSSDPAADASANQLSAQFAGLNCYFLQTGAFELAGNASSEAESLRSRGGAGYVAEDGNKYRVFISTYASRSDADSVRDKLTGEGVESRVHVVECPDKSIGVATDAQKTALEAACGKYVEGIAALNQASMSIDDPAVSQQHAATAAAAFTEVRSQLDTGFASGENQHADDLYDLAGSLAGELSSGDGSQSAIQHAYARACYEYAALALSLTS